MNALNRILIAGLGFALLGCNGNSEPIKKSDAPEEVIEKVSLSPEQASIKGITDSETLIQSLSGKKSLLGRSLLDSDFDTSAFVVETVKCRGLKDVDFLSLIEKAAAEASNSSPVRQDLATEVFWPISETPQSLSLREIWKPLLRQNEF